MDFQKIKALVYRDLLIFRRSKWRITETFYFPITAVLIWGLFALHSKGFHFEAGMVVLIVTVFWNFAHVGQTSVNIQMLQDVWSGSLKQLLLSGISEMDYMVSRLITSGIISVLVLAVLLMIAHFFLEGFPEPFSAIVTISFLTLVTSLSLGVLLTGVIANLGKTYSFLAWTSLQALVLLSAPFFPREYFPVFLQYVSNVMPFTHIFQAAKDYAAGNPVIWHYAFIVTLAYAVIVWPIYLYLFRLAKRNGKLVELG